jgi:hypothetical protein
MERWEVYGGPHAALALLLWMEQEQLQGRGVGCGLRCGKDRLGFDLVGWEKGGG